MMGRWTAMNVKGLAWLGIPADDHASIARFFVETLGLDVAFDEANTTELAAENNDRVQVFGPGHHYFELYRSHGAKIVPLFEVDDLDSAWAALTTSGAEILGDVESDGMWTWLTFKDPGGNLHSLGARCR
jgi:predicted enzyme related to lactoylglutathione lyase